eukprot:1598034-Prorocentrum_lima.AAC.1
MTSSLVGSEMCIRDRIDARLQAGGHLLQPAKCSLFFPGMREQPTDSIAAVSYTHLTLPTICSV